MAIYSKPVLNNIQLYDKLVARGLPAADKPAIYYALERIGYYRFTGYCTPFLQFTAAKKKVFVSGTTTDKILALYRFDTSLRSTLLEVLAKIEIALAVSVCNTLCLNHINANARWFQKPAVFFDKAGYNDIYAEAARHMKFDLVKGKGDTTNTHEFLKHYYQKYTQPPLPPAWMLRECASFGFWSKVFYNLNPVDKSDIAKKWFYPNKKPLFPPVFSSWLHALSVFRNRCAHHSRITYTTIPFSPKTPENNPVAKARFPQADAKGVVITNDLRTFLLVIDILMLNIDPNYEWKSIIRTHFEAADQFGVPIHKATGFQFDWRKDSFWDPWPAK